jgi:hypothetical protein
MVVILFLTCKKSIQIQSHSSVHVHTDVFIFIIAVDRGFEPRSGETKDYKIGMCCFSTKASSIKGKGQILVGSESE